VTRVTDTPNFLDDEHEGTECTYWPHDSKKNPQVSHSSDDEEQSLLTSYHPRPQKKSTVRVEMEDGEQVKPYWLNKGGKEC
jgi:hypothetical protein